MIRKYQLLQVFVILFCVIFEQAFAFFYFKFKIYGLLDTAPVLRMKETSPIHAESALINQKMLCNLTGFLERFSVVIKNS